MVVTGESATHKGNVLLKYGSIILGASFFERLVYLTMMGTLTTFMGRELGFEAVFAQQMQAVATAIVNFLPIFGAVIADKWSGRYWITTVSASMAVIGVSGMAFGSGYKIDWLFLAALFSFFSIPFAIVRPTLIVLGADQFNAKDSVQLKQRSQFFACNYWITNFAACFAFLVLSQIALEGMGAISVTKSFTFVYILSAVCALSCAVILIAGGKKLFSPTPSGSLLIIFGKITGVVLREKKGKTRGVFVVLGLFGLCLGIVLSIVTYFVDSDVLNYLVATIIIICSVLLVIFGRDSKWVELDNKNGYTDEDVHNVRSLYKLTPFVAYAIPFWAVYNQMMTSFISQGCQMNNVINGIAFAPTSLGGYGGIVIIILIPILNYGLYPLSRKLCKGKFTLTPLRRIGVGFIMSALSMMIAGLLEIKRKQSQLLKVECTQESVEAGHCDMSQEGQMINDLSTCYTYTGAHASELVPKSDFNIFYQILSYGCISASEAFLAVTLWEFFYVQVPSGVRSVCQAINFLTISLGTMVGAVINSICRSWLPNNLNNGHQEYMYFINMGFILATFIVFVIASRHFEYAPGTSYYVDDVVIMSEEPSLTSSSDKSSDENSLEYHYYTESSIDETAKMEGVMLVNKE